MTVLKQISKTGVSILRQAAQLRAPQPHLPVSTGVGSTIFEQKTLKSGDTYKICVSGTIKTKDSNQELKLDLCLGSSLMHTTTFIDLDDLRMGPYTF